jgi:phosphatidylglycerol---prolipoprotein diacylglyceryl transferase
VHPVLFHIGPILVPSYGAIAAVGVLLALFLAQRTARIARVDPTLIWNLSVISVFAAIVGQRLLLIVANWSALRHHPSWMLALAMVHHPLLAGTGVVCGILAAVCYGHWRKMPFWPTADTLAAPLALGLAFEQFGALLAGSGYGVNANPKLPWAITYTSALAARWSGTPIGVPLHPVQAYAALAFLALAVFLFLMMPALIRPGDTAGISLMGLGAIVFLTELWRDPEGRGGMLRGAVDAPQLAAVLLVLAGAFALRERKVQA